MCFGEKSEQSICHAQSCTQNRSKTDPRLDLAPNKVTNRRLPFDLFLFKIPTGFQSKQLIVQGGLTLGDIDQYHKLDITIDGADEVDKDLHCIKGGGACQLREKVLAEAAETFIVVADFRKNTNLLGTSYTQGVPIEVSPFAYQPLLSTIRTTLGCPNAGLRMAKMKAGPVVTDNGNFVIDAPFGSEALSNPVGLLHKIKLLTGVVEVGLFCNITKAAYFGNEDGSVSARWADGVSEQILPQ